jgi:AraC family transcriptional regulator
MHIKIESRPAFEVVGMKYRGKNEGNEIPQLWNTFVPRIKEISHRVDNDLSFGVMDNYDEATGEFDYFACVAVDSTRDVPKDMASYAIPEQTYSVFKCTLPTIRDAFQYANQEWFPASDYKRAPGPEFELYDKDFDKDETIYIYIPIEEPSH